MIKSIIYTSTFFLLSVSWALALTSAGGGTPGGSSGFPNPLRYDTLTQFLEALLDTVILIAIPIIVLAIIYAGFLFVSARGNETNLKNAKTIIVWTIIGALLILGAKVLSSAIKGTVDELQVDSELHLQIAQTPQQSVTAHDV